MIRYDTKVILKAHITFPQLQVCLQDQAYDVAVAFSPWPRGTRMAYMYDTECTWLRLKNAATLAKVLTKHVNVGSRRPTAQQTNFK